MEPSIDEIDSRGRELPTPQRKGPPRMDRIAEAQAAEEEAERASAFLSTRRAQTQPTAEEQAQLTWKRKYRGVSWHFDRCRWQIHIRAGGIQFHLGEEVPGRLDHAAQTYDDARYWLQDFSRSSPRLNFPDRPPGPPSRKVLIIRARLTEDGYPRYEHDPAFLPPPLKFDSSGTIRPMPVAAKVEPDECVLGALDEWRQSLVADFEGSESELRAAILKLQPAYVVEAFPAADKVAEQLKLLAASPRSGVSGGNWRISPLSLPTA